MKGSKIGYLITSILSIVFLFLLTPIQRYFSYLASTTYNTIWIWISIALVAVLAIFFGLSLCWSRGLSRNFRIPAEAVKAALALAALGFEFLYYMAPSTVTVFCAALFLTGFFANLAGGNRQV